MEERVGLSELVREYKKLPVDEKRKELGKEITEVMVVLKKLIDEDLDTVNMDYNNLDEYTNMYQTSTSEDEYLSGLFEDVLNMKELMGIYLSKFQ